MYKENLKSCLNDTLNEQVAMQIFSNLPENAPLVVITDRKNNLWTSNSEKYSGFALDDLLISDICNSIDDGAEPVVAHIKDATIIAAQLTTARDNCSYVFIVLEQFSPKPEVWTLVEMLLNQMSAVAELIEKNDLSTGRRTDYICPSVNSMHLQCSLN